MRRLNFWEGSLPKIQTESYYYSSLTRPSAQNLPGFHSKDAVFPSPAMQVLADKIYRSDVTIHCTEGESEDQEWQVYYVNAYENNPYQAEQQCPLPHEREPIITLVFARNRQVHEWIRSWFPRIEFRECGDNLLHNSQVPALTHRVMHLFLRVAGAKLEPHVFHDMASSLMDYYLERQWFKEALDLAIIQADVAFNTDGGTCRVVGQMVRVGESLESVGSFETAAKLYEEIAYVFWDKSTEALVARSDLYTFAGLAWKRARTFEKAESAFLNALHFLFGEAQQDRLVGIFREMVNMYKAWYSSSHTRVELVLHIAILTSLAVLAGVKFPKEELDDTLGFLCRIPGQNAKGKKLALLFVNPKYATKKKALWILKTAAADPDSVTTFRNTLRRCAKAGLSGKLEMEIFASAESVETPTKEYKSNAREFLTQTVSKTTIKQGCTNCDACKPPSAFRVCAGCKEVSYVSDKGMFAAVLVFVSSEKGICFVCLTLSLL